MKALGTALFFLFVGVQVAATFLGSLAYPFNGYQMFSKNWPDGAVMTQIQIVPSDGRNLSPWDVIPIPFFQANQIMYSKFLNNTMDGKFEVCRYLVHQVGIVDIFADEVSYRRRSNGMIVQLKEHRWLYRCMDPAIRTKQ